MAVAREGLRREYAEKIQEKARNQQHAKFAVKPKITRAVLEGSLYCMYKAYLKMNGERGTRSDYELMLEDNRAALKLLATNKILKSVPDGEVSRHATLTSSVLKEGLPILLDSSLESTFESLSFDGLKRVEGASTLGSFHYIPLLFHEVGTVRKEQKLLLELYGLSLAKKQGNWPAYGIVWYGSSCKSRTVRLFSDAQQAQRLFESLKQLLGSSQPPRLILNKHCSICEFRDRCQLQAVEEDSLSLLRGLGEKKIKTNAKKGIFTLTQFAHTFRPRRRRKRGATPVLSKQRYHALQAKAIRDNRVYMLGSEQLQNQPVHIYFDLEGLPEEGYVYLIGMIISDASLHTVERHSFWAESKREESWIFEQFLDILAKYDNFLIFSYGAYEKAFITRMRKNSKRKRPVDRLVEALVNTLSLIYSHLYFPCHSNGLKDIGGYLGCSWTEEDASGIQSIVWRKRWETTRDIIWKKKLLVYNQEDCFALRKVTEFVYAVTAETSRPTEPSQSNAPAKTLATKVEDSDENGNTRPNWGKMTFFHSDYEFVNKCGYFDYQRQRVYVRTNKTLKRIARNRRNPRVQHNRKLRVSKHVQIVSRKCPECKSPNLIRDIGLSCKGPRSKRAFDLTVTPNGLKRKVIEYRTSPHRCRQCGETFIPHRYTRLARHLHGLMSWAIYMHVENRISFGILQKMCNELFGIHILYRQLLKFKFLMSQRYRTTHHRLWQEILSSSAIYIDETEVKLQRNSKAYVWVFTTMDAVIYLYKPTRAADFLHALLKDFKGVVVSDFYSGYDSLPCSQQKCLLHLMRDINQELLRNPYDEALQSITMPFGTLLRAVVETIDTHGLKKRFLKKHERDVATFFRQLSKNCFRTDAAEELRSRLLKYQDRLFTFLRHDGVAWNNNNAEHAIKRFAYYRAERNGMLSETGLVEYLALLSICETCRYKGVSFYRFLLSREKDVVAFQAGKKRKRQTCSVEIYPKNYPYKKP